jgi:hypothetical protein
MERTVKRSLAVVVFVIALFAFTISAYAAGYYIHDPMANPKAAADIIVDPDAVYGYAPNPDSVRLGAFAKYDWSDTAFVAQMKQEREAYHESIRELYQTKADMEAQGKSVEEIARAVSNRRNEMRIEAYKDDPDGLATLKESNLEKYGNENGGTPEYYYEKTGSWEAVIEKAFSTNAGADAMLGLYDTYYDTYYIVVDSDPTESETAAEPSQAVTEPTAAALVESTPDQALTPTGNLSKTSPQTEDPAAAVMFIMMTATGVACICIIKLSSHKAKR